MLTKCGEICKISEGMPMIITDSVDANVWTLKYCIN